jgi:hypothetical protein
MKFLLDIKVGLGQLDIVQRRYDILRQWHRRSTWSYVKLKMFERVKLTLIVFGFLDLFYLIGEL